MDFLLSRSGLLTRRVERRMANQRMCNSASHISDRDGEYNIYVMAQSTLSTLSFHVFGSRLSMLVTISIRERVLFALIYIRLAMKCEARVKPMYIIWKVCIQKSILYSPMRTLWSI
jgi:hypothetical protein